MQIRFPASENFSKPDALQNILTYNISQLFTEDPALLADFGPVLLLSSQIGLDFPAGATTQASL